MLAWWCSMYYGIAACLPSSLLYTEHAHCSLDWLPMLVRDFSKTKFSCSLAARSFCKASFSRCKTFLASSFAVHFASNDFNRSLSSLWSPSELQSLGDFCDAAVKWLLSYPSSRISSRNFSSSWDVRFSWKCVGQYRHDFWSAGLATITATWKNGYYYNGTRRSKSTKDRS